MRHLPTVLLGWALGVCAPAAAHADDVGYEPSRVLEVGAQLFMPIYLDSDPLGVGIGGRGRAAWHLPFGLRPEIQLGYSVQDVAGQEDALTLIQLSAGVRYGLPRLGRLEPIIGAGVSLDYWSRSLEAPRDEDPEPMMEPDATNGGFGALAEPDDTVFLPSVYALVGIAGELWPWLLFDLGVRLDVAPNRDPFSDNAREMFGKTQLYLSPFAGLSFIY